VYLLDKKRVGKIAHFLNKISVAVVNVEATIKKGDTISIEGPNTNFKQKVESMQIDKKDVAEAKKGQAIGLKVAEKVKENDVVYKA
jgi:putative protease